MILIVLFNLGEKWPWDLPRFTSTPFPFLFIFVFLCTKNLFKKSLKGVCTCHNCLSCGKV